MNIKIPVNCLNAEVMINCLLEPGSLLPQYVRFQSGLLSRAPLNSSGLEEALSAACRESLMPGTNEVLGCPQ